MVHNFIYTVCLANKIIWSIEYKGNIKQLSLTLKSLQSSLVMILYFSWEPVEKV